MGFYKRTSGVVVLVGLLATQSAIATNGYFANGMGSRNKAMAGAGMALPEGAMAVVNNPALAAILDEATEVGLSVFIPRRNVATDPSGNDGQNGAFTIGPLDIDSDDELFLVPEVARTHRLKNGDAFAWAVYMRAGMSTSYKGGSVTFDPDGDGPLGIVTRPGIYGDGNAGLEMSQLFADVTWARRWGENTALGITAVLAAQSLRVQGTGGLAKYTRVFVASDGSELPGALADNGRDITYGAGLKFGVHQRLGQHFAIGAMFQSKIHMSKAGDYADLLASGGDLDIPAWARLGLTWMPLERLAISLDAQQIWYSKIAALGNSFENIATCPAAGAGGNDVESCLGGSNGPGFAWKDVPVYSLGVRWQVSDKWTWRAGISISDQPTPISENTLNVLLPSLTETHYAAGLSRRLSNGHELSFAFSYTEEESIEHPNQLDLSQLLELTTDQFDIEISYSWGN